MSIFEMLALGLTKGAGEGVLLATQAKQEQAAEESLLRKQREEAEQAVEDEQNKALRNQFISTASDAFVALAPTQLAGAGLDVDPEDYASAVLYKRPSDNLAAYSSTVSRLLSDSNLMPIYASSQSGNQTGQKLWTQMRSAIVSSFRGFIDKSVEASGGESGGVNQPIPRINVDFREQLMASGLPEDEIQSIIDEAVGFSGDGVYEYRSESPPDGPLIRFPLSANLPQEAQEAVNSMAKTATGASTEAGNQNAASGRMQNLVTGVYKANNTVFKNEQEIVNDLRLLWDSFRDPNTMARGYQSINLVAVDRQPVEDIALKYYRVGGMELAVKMFEAAESDHLVGMGTLPRGAYADPLAVNRERMASALDMSDTKELDAFFVMHSKRISTSEPLDQNLSNMTDLISTYDTKIGLAGGVNLTLQGIESQFNMIKNMAGLDEDDNKYLKRLKNNILSANDEDARKTAVFQYLKVQTLYTLARMMENPEGGGARLAANDIENMANAFNIGYFADPSSVLTVLNYTRSRIKPTLDLSRAILEKKDAHRVLAAQLVSGLLPKDTFLTSTFGNPTKADIMNNITRIVSRGEQDTFTPTGSSNRTGA
jgi:hypothetical protein